MAGNLVFGDGDNRFGNADMGFATLTANDGALGRWFRRAAEVLVRTAEGRRESTEAMFYPVAYNYRQYLELTLKDLIRTAGVLEIIQLSNRQRKRLERHDLTELWTLAREVLIGGLDVAADDPHLAHVERVIQEYAQHDPRGTAFRYSRGLKGERHLLSLPRIVNLGNLRDETNRAGTFLEGCAMYLDAALDGHLEAKADAQGLECEPYGD